MRNFLAFISLLLALGAAVAPPYARAVGPHPTVPADGVPWSFAAPGRVVAIGDVHGDATALLTILQKMNLVDQSGRWIGGKTQLVFTGDLNDRGDTTRVVYDLVISLEIQALRVGGAVHTLLGNHEMLVTEANLRFATREEARLFGSAKHPADHPFQDLQAAIAGDQPYGRWLQRRNSMVRVGDTLFVHGGVEEWAAHTDPGAINSTVRAWVRSAQKVGPAPPPDTAWVLAGGNPLAGPTALEGPLWSRKIATGQLDPQILRQVMQNLGVRRVVVGHTAKSGPIRTQYDGQVVIIDTGISRAYKGQLSALELQGDQATAHHFTRPAEEHPLVLAYRQQWEKGREMRFPLPKTCLRTIAGWLAPRK